MGALPQSTPETPRKPAAKARKPAKKLEPCQPRTLPQIQADYRSRTNYQKGTGYFPMFHALAEDILRLSSGRACDWVIQLTVQAMSIAGKGPDALQESVDFAVAELALRIGCDERQINRVLEYLVVRGMAGVDRMEGGRFLITLNFRQWGSIGQSYAEWDAERRAAEAQESAEQNPDQPLEVRPGTVALTQKPVPVKAGEKSKPIPVTTGVRSLRIHWQSKVLDLSFEAVVTSGELVLTGNLPHEATANSTQQAKPADSTRSRHTSGHGSPNESKSPTNEGRRKPPQTGVDPIRHHRAEELAQIFDPLIYAHCKLTLSGDPRYHQQACDLIGDTPHEELLKAAIERGARMLKPSHIPALCKQIQHNWIKGLTMPAAAQPVPQLTIGQKRALALMRNLEAVDRMRNKGK